MHNRCLKSFNVKYSMPINQLVFLIFNFFCKIFISNVHGALVFLVQYPYFSCAPPFLTVSVNEFCIFRSDSILIMFVLPRIKFYSSCFWGSCFRI